MTAQPDFRAEVRDRLAKRDAKHFAQRDNLVRLLRNIIAARHNCEDPMPAPSILEARAYLATIGE